MIRIIFLLGLLGFMSCKLDQNKGKELIEVDELDLDSNLLEEPVSTGEYLEVPKEHMGALVEKADKYVILASDLVEGTFNEDYKDIDITLELYPETFTYSSKVTGDANPGTKDSIVSLKYKTSLFEFRKIDQKSSLLQARLSDELFLLQNGVRPGLDIEETFAKFGLNKVIKQNTIEVISEKSKNKILLVFSGDTLKRIELHPESK